MDTVKRIRYVQGYSGQWSRLGWITGILEIVTRVDGEEKQRYLASDMMMSPMETVSRLSENMTLCPGDVICCGTSVGLGPMPRGCTVEVEIEGIGCLRNEYR